MDEIREPINGMVGIDLEVPTEMTTNTAESLLVNNIHGEEEK